MKKKIFLITALNILLAYNFLVNPEVSMAKLKEIQLPPVSYQGKVSLEEAISKRRSQRSFRQKDLSWEEVGQLLWAAQGITGKSLGLGFRASPSAGALYPMEIYALTKDGLFHYLADGHKLEVLNDKDLRKDLASAAFGQGSVSQAPLDIVIAAVFKRVTAKYGQRGIRYVHIEAGHIAQNIHLQAVALGLGSFPIGAFSDEQVQTALSLPKDHAPLYIIPVGYTD